MKDLMDLRNVYHTGFLVCDSDAIKDFPTDVIDQCPRIEFSKVESIFLRYQNFNVLNADSFAKFPNLVTLTMSRCNIKKVLYDTFKDQKKLRQVFLSDNNISIIEDGVFDDLISIDMLDLDSNPINR